MTIRSVAHRGLRRFIERDDSSGLDPAIVEKVRHMGHPRELRTLPHWKAHQLTGNRKNTWSLTVSRNWRITFLIDERTNEIYDLDFEDYH